MGLEAPPPLNTSFPSPLDIGRKQLGDQRPSELQSPPTPPPTNPPRRENLSLCVPLAPSSSPLGSLTLSLIHPSFPGSSPARPHSPLARPQHNGLAAFRFHDTLPPGLLLLRRALANTRPARLSHSLDTQCPAASHHPDSLQSQCAHSQERFLQLGPGFWEGGPEVAGVGGGVVHICFREKLLPRNWPWAKQQVVHFGMRQERGLESRSGAMTFLPSLPAPAPAPQARQERELQPSQESSLTPGATTSSLAWGHPQGGGRSLTASP